MDGENILSEFKDKRLHPICRFRNDGPEEVASELAFKVWVRVGLGKALTTTNQRLTCAKHLLNSTYVISCGSHKASRGFDYCFYYTGEEAE